MGWFGMPGHNENSAFDVLFSQSQYSQKFELIEQKHRYNKSFALYTLDGKYRSEVILWNDDGQELMYKSLKWTDFVDYIPKKWIEKLLSDASEQEIRWYTEAMNTLNQKNRIKADTRIKLDTEIEFESGEKDDTFTYLKNGYLWAENMKKRVNMSKKQIIQIGFTILEG